MKYNVLGDDVYVVEVTNIKRKYEDGYHDRVMYLCERGTCEQLSVLSTEMWLFGSIEDARKECTNEMMNDTFEDAKFRIIKLNAEVVYPEGEKA